MDLFDASARNRKCRGRRTGLVGSSSLRGFQHTTVERAPRPATPTQTPIDPTGSVGSRAGKSGRGVCGKDESETSVDFYNLSEDPFMNHAVLSFTSRGGRHERTFDST